MNLTPARRRYIYRIAIAVLAILVMYGIIDGDASDAWLLIIAAILGLADKNVSE